MNQPLEAGNLLLSDVVDMAIRGQGDPLAVKRIERTVQSFQAKGAGQPAINWLILGFTAFLQGRPAECVRCVEAACKVAPNDVTVIGNASSVFTNAGEPRRALTYARQLNAIARDDSQQVHFSSLLLRKMLHFEEAENVMRDSKNSSDSVLRESSQALAKIADARGLTPEFRLALLETAISAVRSEGCAIKQTSLTEYPNATLRFEMFIDESASQCGNVNFAIAEALTEKFEDAHPEFITFACRPITSFNIAGTFIEVSR